jgi:signal peptidase I
MSPIFLAVLLAFLGLVAGYLVNQLPELKNFPGKNAFIWRVLAEVVALIIVSTTFGAISGQNDPKNADQLAWLARIEKGILVAGAILAFDCLLTGSTAWKHYTSGAAAGIEDKEQRLELLRSVSEDVRQRQRENFKNLEPQIVIPLGLQDVREEVGQSRFIATEDSQEPRAAQPILLRLKRFLRLGDRPEAEIPATQRLIDVFDRVDRRLLILGKPGAGKTTLLLELAEQLLADAQQSDCNEIPVRLECSDWKDDNQSLSEWLTLQLKDRYRVPFELSRQWIERRQLVPLLDGLDELGLERQQKATNAIAKFIKDNNYPAMVVCCRQEEWQQARAAEAQETQFGLNGAVYLEPLTDEQIQSYLQQVKRPRLWAHIQSSDLQALLPDWDDCKKDGEVPGLRSPLLLNMLLVAYKDGQVIRSQSELFQAYIKAQFIRVGKSKYTEAQTRRYLTWLARQLKAERTTEFEIESLRPSWLRHTWQRWIYRLIVGIIYGLILGLTLGLIVKLILGLIFGIIYGLIYGLIGILDGIPTTDSFDLSAKGIRRGIIGGLIGGLILGIISGLILGLILGIIGGLILGIISGLILGLIFGMIYGLESTEISSKSQPNEGMWNTAKNSIFISIISFPVGILLFTLPSLAAGQSVEWEKWILYGLAGGLIFSLYSFPSLIKHGVLRLLLWANGSIPWNYAAFLDHANKLRLVQSMGGRYRFVHDLLREEMIGSTLPARRLASTPDWIQYPGMLIGAIVALSAGQGTQMVSSKLAQVTMPILHTRDLVFFDKYSYHFTEPQRDDLVSFRSEDSKKLGIEWIVGLPGETISIKDNQLLINGKPSDRPYTHFPQNYSIDKPFKVPAQSYFVMGKRIDKDGKIVPTGEVIQRKQLTSRCLWRLWPLHRFGAVK